MAVFNDGELIEDEPVVILRVGKVDRVDFIATNDAVFGAEFDIAPFHQSLVQAAVCCDQVRFFGGDDFSEGIAAGCGKDGRVEAIRGISQPLNQNHITRKGLPGWELNG